MGPLIADLEGTSLTDLDRALLDGDSLGGLIFFSRNFSDLEQLMGLIAEVRSRRPELLLTVDHEGGRVQRFKAGFTQLPAAGQILTFCQGDLNQAADIARQLGWLMASELRACDIDLSFAPVLDVNGDSEVIGLRAFASEPQFVSSLAGAYIDGMHLAGMACVGKHFPGHGSVTADSHVAAPVDSRSWEEIQSLDLKPFAELTPKLDGLMPAHVTYPKVDNRPAGFSPLWLKEVLRKQLGFNGAIFTDDLGMVGAQVGGDLLERTQLAFAAGCDLALVCNLGEQALELARTLDLDREKTSQSRHCLEKLRGGAARTWEQLAKSNRWKNAATLAEEVCSKG